MLTARGRLTIALGLLAGLAGRILGLPELFGLAAAAVLVACAAIVQVHAAAVRVAVTGRAVPEVVDAGDAARLDLVLEVSGRRLLSSSLQLVSNPGQATGWRQPDRILLPDLRPGSCARIGFELPTDRRGVVEAGGYEVTLRDALGLAQRRLGTSAPARCVVLPRFEILPSSLPVAARRLVAGQGFPDEEGLSGADWLLRGYADGDDLRLVHWPTTARLGRLMVRQVDGRPDDSRHSSVVLLDASCDAKGADFERAVEIAASVLTAAEAEGGAGFRLVATTGLDTGCLSGPEGLREGFVALAQVQPTAVRSAGRFGRAVKVLGAPDGPEALVIVGCLGEATAPVVPERLAKGRAVISVRVGQVPSEVRGLYSFVLGAAGQTAVLRLGERRVLEIVVAADTPLSTIWNADEWYASPAPRRGAAAGLREGAAP